MLARAARRQDIGRANGNPRPQWKDRRRLSCQAQKSQSRLLSRPAGPSPALAGQAPDDWLRLADQRQYNAEEIARLLVGRIARRGRNVNLASRNYDPRRARTQRPQSNWHYRWLGTDLRRHRGCGRHSRRFGSGVERDLIVTSQRSSMGIQITEWHQSQAEFLSQWFTIDSFQALIPSALGGFS